MTEAESPRVRAARRRFGARSIVAFAAVAFGAVPFAILILLVAAKSGTLQRLDQDSADALHSFAVAHHWFISAMKLISGVGSPTGWRIILTPVLLWLLYRRFFRAGVFLVVTALGSSLLNTVLKALVDRARPHLPDPIATAHGTSFPSGHAQAATVGCGIVLVILLTGAQRLRQWLYAGAAALVVLAIGFSRIALGVHYVSDVIGGYLIGAAWLLAMSALFTPWQRERPR